MFYFVFIFGCFLVAFCLIVFCFCLFVYLVIACLFVWLVVCLVDFFFVSLWALHKYIVHTVKAWLTMVPSARLEDEEQREHFHCKAVHRKASIPKIVVRHEYRCDMCCLFFFSISTSAHLFIYIRTTYFIFLFFFYFLLRFFIYFFRWEFFFYYILRSIPGISFLSFCIFPPCLTKNTFPRKHALCNHFSD